MKRVLTIALLVSLASPAAADWTPEQRAMIDCVRNQPIEDIIDHRSRCGPPAGPVKNVFAPGMGSVYARQIAKLQAMLPLCKSLKAGPSVPAMWTSVWETFRYVEADRPAVLAWIAKERDQYRQEFARVYPTNQSICDRAKTEFGALRKMVVNLDDSIARPKCYRTDTCADSSYIYDY